MYTYRRYDTIRYDPHADRIREISENVPYPLYFRLDIHWLLKKKAAKRQSKEKKQFTFVYYRFNHFLHVFLPLYSYRFLDIENTFLDKINRSLFFVRRMRVKARKKKKQEKKVGKRGAETDR